MRLALTAYGPARIAASWGATPRPLREAVDVAARLLVIADQVERLGRGARNGPEAFVVEKLSAARELRVLAREIETCR